MGPEDYDFIMGITSFIFIYGVLMQNIKLFKTKDASSISYNLSICNSLALSVVCWCMFGLGLYLSAWTLVIQTFLWYTVLFFKIRYDR
jgi:uncharacterized protein with PQ loop repeat